MLNSSGVNIGNFVLPFAQGFLGPAGVMAVSLFDVGNAFTCLGGAYSVAGMILEDRKGFSFRPVLRALGKSVPLITYVIVCLLSILRVSLPGPVVSLAGIIGIALAVLCRLFLPVPEIYRPALVIPFLGPVATAAPAFTAQLKGDYELASAVNSCSILISVALITGALVLF